MITVMMMITAILMMILAMIIIAQILMEGIVVGNSFVALVEALTRFETLFFL